MAARKRLFSGMQPSGELHLGNLEGAVRNWVRLQERFDAIFCVVDLHAMTQEYDPGAMQRRILEMATDFLACGIDPERAIVFVQSRVPEHTELAWVFNTLTPLGDLYRMTQFKDKMAKKATSEADVAPGEPSGEEPQEDEGATNIGLLDYPVLQAADILLYQAEVVPVGEDQVQHIELTRRIGRRFNTRFRTDFFAEPAWELSPVPRMLGLDGNAKMSKSKGNTIALGDDEATIRGKLKVAVTDTKRVRRKDPGEPNDCNIYSLHKVYSTADDLTWVEQGCRSAGIGCFDCKTRLADRMVASLAPIQEKRRQLEKEPDTVRDVLADGARRAGEIAAPVMEKVREIAGLR